MGGKSIQEQSYGEEKRGEEAKSATEKKKEGE